jgi:hypothetical protein
MKIRTWTHNEGRSREIYFWFKHRTLHVTWHGKNKTPSASSYHVPDGIDKSRPIYDHRTGKRIT